MLDIQKKIFTSFEEAGISIPSWNTRDKFSMRCPKCSDDRKLQNKNKKVLGIAITAKLFNCNHCGYSGKIVDKLNAAKYFRPEPIKKRADDDLLSDAAKEYLMSRNLDIQAALQMGCISDFRAYPSKNEEGFEKKESIVFPYNDPTGNILFYKFRSFEKDFSGSKQPQYVFWQLDKFKDKKILIVTEGEYDAISWKTAFNLLPNDWKNKGKSINVNDIALTSVPNGISTKQLQQETVIIEYFERCIEHIKHFEQVFISTDNDEAGILLQGELSRRFGRDICKIIKFPNTTDQKDANGVLIVQDAKALQSLFNKADYLPIEGIYTTDDVKQSLDAKLGTTLSKGHTVGYESLDELVSFDISEGLTLITGAPNSAKSDFMFNIMIRLSLRYGWKWLICSPETGDVETVYKEILIKLIGKTFYKTDFKIETMTPDEYEWGMAFLKSHVYVMESIDLKEYTLESFIKKTENCVKKYGINAAVIDPFNSFDDAFGGGMMANKLNTDLTMLQASKRKLGINYFIIAHPNATVIGQMTNPYQVNGGASWLNKMDLFFILNRGEKTNHTDGRGDDIEIRIVKVKKRHLGKRGEVLAAYNIPTGRFAEIPVVHKAELFEQYTTILANFEQEKQVEYDPFENVEPLPQIMPRAKIDEFGEADFEQLF